MQTTRLLLAALTSAFASLLLTPAVFAQGALTPPGAPAPMFKTLDQIEARKPLGTPNVVTTSTIVISEPGSYVLVGPITVSSGDGITINANNVTLDLNGFTISSTASSGDGAGVKINGDGSSSNNIAISNGFVSGAYVIDAEGNGTGNGFIHGIVCLVGSYSNLRAHSVTVRGVRLYGIYLPGGSVSRCQVSDTGNNAITASLVETCIVNNVRSTATGINAGVVSNCQVSALKAYRGIMANIVSNSMSVADKVGIEAANVSNSYGQGDDYGIHSQYGSVSYSSGRAEVSGNPGRSIKAAIAVACTSAPTPSYWFAPIESPQKHLGTTY